MWHYISSSAPGCIYLGAIIHLHVGASMSICVCMCIGVTYMYVYACGDECICTSVCGHKFYICMNVHGCVCVCVCIVISKDS